jgi:son of sevenless-like protein
MLMTQSATPVPLPSDSSDRNNRTTSRYRYDNQALDSTIDAYPSTADLNNSTYTAPSVKSQSAYRASPILMNGFSSNAPQPVMYVRALYDYEADDRTSLSFHEGDVIQVITQLESGWWDGVINGVRGWFPSNYCQVVSNPEDVLEEKSQDEPEEDEDLEDEDDYDDQYEEDDDMDSEGDGAAQLPIEGVGKGDKARADFWIPQATSDGRLYYYNTMTGESSMELPLESPSSSTENGPRDRMTVNVPDKTRPPPEMMAQGYIQDEEYESEGNSASELEGESIMMASKSSLVC